MTGSAGVVIINGMTAPVDTPIFFQVITATGINPYAGPTVIVDKPNRAPRPGQKPIRKKRK